MRDRFSDVVFYIVLLLIAGIFYATVRPQAPSAQSAPSWSLRN
jgi:hypothetical protein